MEQAGLSYMAIKVALRLHFTDLSKFCYTGLWLVTTSVSDHFLIYREACGGLWGGVEEKTLRRKKFRRKVDQQEDKRSKFLIDFPTKKRRREKTPQTDIYLDKPIQ